MTPEEKEIVKDALEALDKFEGIEYVRISSAESHKARIVWLEKRAKLEELIK